MVHTLRFVITHVNSNELAAFAGLKLGRGFDPHRPYQPSF